MEMLRPDGHVHKWPKLADEQRHRSYGHRVVFTCNDCYAMKVVFTIHNSDGTNEVKTVVVEPPPRW